MPRVPSLRLALLAAVLVMLAGCGESGTSSVPSTPASQPPPSDAAASDAPASPAEQAGRERLSSEVVFESEAVTINGFVASGQPSVIDPILEPDRSVIGGGPTDAGAETIEEIAGLSYADVEAFWSSTWESGYSTIFYEPPAGLELYDSSVSEIPEFSCASSSDDPSVYAVNAFYCYGDRTIAYDVVLASDELARIGDFAIVGTIAHEWGHHLQNLILTQPSHADVPTFSIESELQADCFAGMYVASAGTSGTFPVSIEDVEEAALGFYNSGTDAGYGWFEPTFHGTPQERYDAFLYGYRATEVRACDAYATYMLDYTVGDGPYAIGYVEGTTVDYLPTEAYVLTGGSYGDVQLVADAITVAADDWDGSFVEAVTTYLAASGGDLSALTLVGDVTDYSATTQAWGIPGRTYGFTYSYAGSDASRHGHMTVHLTPAEHALILDTSLPGAGTLDTFTLIGEAAELSISSFQVPGI